MNATAGLRIDRQAATCYRGPVFAAVSVPDRRDAAPAYEGGVIVARCEKRWTGIRAMLLDVRSDGGIEVDLGASSARLSVIIEQVGGGMDMTAASAGGPRQAAAEGGISVIAANGEARAHGRSVSFIRHLILDIDAAAVADLTDEPIDLRKALATRLSIADERLMTICRRFAEECASAEPANRLYGDGLSIALLRRLALLDPAPRDAVAKGGLAPWQLRRVIEHLNGNLAEDVPMPKLAAIAGLSDSYFRRAFKSSTGVAPSQWLIQARCDRAKQLLVENRLGLAEIALDLGFCDQAHFSRSFARTVGMSPGAWRRERLAGVRARSR